MGLFKKLKQSTGHQDATLKDRGIAGTAKVLSSKESMLSIGGDDDSGEPLYYKNVLEVTLPGEPSFQFETHMKSGGAVGAEWPVYVDPADHTQVFVDLAAYAKAHGPRGLSAMAPAQRAVVEQSIATTLSRIQDPARRKAVIEQYRNSGIDVNDDGTIGPTSAPAPPPASGDATSAG